MYVLKAILHLVLFFFSLCFEFRQLFRCGQVHIKMSTCYIHLPTACLSFCYGVYIELGRTIRLRLYRVILLGTWRFSQNEIKPPSFTFIIQYFSAALRVGSIENIEKCIINRLDDLGWCRIRREYSCTCTWTDRVREEKYKGSFRVEG